MKKVDNFVNCFAILQKAEPERVQWDDLYRMGVIGQFNLTFELAWKALQAVLRLHSVAEAETGSPREILKLAYKVNFLSDADVWLDMLRQRNQSIHIYDEEKIDKLISLIFEYYIPAFSHLAETLQQKVEEAGGDWV